MRKSNLEFRIVFILLCFFKSSILLATQTTYTFYPTADTFLTGSEHINENEGLNTHLRIQHPTRFSNVILKFSQQDLINTIGSNYERIVSATLKLYIETNFNNWGSGAYVDVYRIDNDWQETSSTWACPVDSNLGNTNPDCDEQWNGGYFDDYLSASLLHQNSQIGWKNFDVTTDVQLFLNGLDHYGWLLRKRDFNAGGSVDYTSIQGTAANKPRLEVVVDDQSSCTPTVLQSILPAVIPADGTNQTLTVTGQGLDRVTSVLVDNSAVTFTLVNSTKITFIRNYSSPGIHDVTFRTTCLKEKPIDVYEIEAVSTSLYQGLVGSCTDCPAPGKVTYFSHKGVQLCWRRCLTRLIGYGGDFSNVTWDFKWDTDTNGDGVNDDDDDDSGNSNTDLIRGYLGRAQYNSASEASSRGFNLSRVFTVGGSCNYSPGPAACKGYKEDVDDPETTGHKPETMPFPISGNKYDITNMTNDGYNLNPNWKRRLKNYLRYADQNGIAVQLTLFDENILTGQSDWPNNPWNLANNNVTGCSAWPPAGSTSAFPQFYKICTDFTNEASCNRTLNCLGLRERAYVLSIGSVIKRADKCGDAGTTQCRNIIIEIMNEALFNESWTSTDLTTTQFKVWHDTVASWIMRRGTHIVAANVKPTNSKGICSGVDPDIANDTCRLQDCNTSSCPNYFNALHAPLIDLVNLHWGSWVGELCTWDDDALKFGKPVMFDTDGGCGEKTDPFCSPNGHPRNSDSNLERWAEINVKSGCNNDRVKGTLHFYQTGDGTRMQSSSPTQCVWDDHKWIDCAAWNGIADGEPDKFCGPDVTDCVTRVDYCENGPQGGCPQNDH